MPYTLRTIKGPAGYNSAAQADEDCQCRECATPQELENVVLAMLFGATRSRDQHYLAYAGVSAFYKGLAMPESFAFMSEGVSYSIWYYA